MSAHHAQIGQKAPLLAVSEWVQGGPVNLDGLLGRVVLVEVFQVNCPGCFIYALPEACKLLRRYADMGLTVLGLATAFEDFNKNTSENLRRLVGQHEVIGETFKALNQRGLLDNGRLSYRIPFPLAMDVLTRRMTDVNDDEVFSFIQGRLPGFDFYPDDHRQQVIKQVRSYLETQCYRAETFERFELRGTPSHIVVDKAGVLRGCEFGAFPELEGQLFKLLRD